MTNMTANQEQKYLSLYEELEVRYGAALAQELIDQIKKADEQNNMPDYMTVKAVSEVVETLRREGRDTIKKLKQARSYKLSSDVACLDQKRLENDLKHIYVCYRLTQEAFYKLYNRAMKICEVPETYCYDRYSNPTKMNLAA